MKKFLENRFLSIYAMIVIALGIIVAADAYNTWFDHKMAKRPEADPAYTGNAMVAGGANEESGSGPYVKEDPAHSYPDTPDPGDTDPAREGIKVDATFENKMDNRPDVLAEPLAIWTHPVTGERSAFYFGPNRVFTVNLGPAEKASLGKRAVLTEILKNPALGEALSSFLSNPAPSEEPADE